MSIPSNYEYKSPVRPGAQFHQGIPMPVSVDINGNDVNLECPNAFLASLFVSKMKKEFDGLAVVQKSGKTVTVSLTADAIEHQKTADDLKAVLSSKLGEAFDKLSG